MLTTLIQQVKANCQRASGAQAGFFSLCGLLLRLRVLYKWERGLLPWQEPEPDAVLDWVAQQESAWDATEGDPWDDLRLNGLSLDPFAVNEVNALVRPEGLAYGAGFGRGLAPTFFLGELAEERTDGDLTILVLGDELARDLAGVPALAQGPLIYARTQALAFYLWDRLSDPAQQANRYLKVALDAQKVCLSRLLKDPEAHQEQFCFLLAGELESVIRHEMGEARESSLREILPRVLALFPQTRIELFMRGLKDALAEVNDWGRLSFIIGEQNLTSLALFLALQPPLYALLLSELEPAFWDVANRGAWETLESARLAALARLSRVAAQVGELCSSPPADPSLLRQELETRFLAPLGL